MNKLVIASSNHGKIIEIQAILSDVECISQSDLGINSIEETGLTFVENAILKARHASRLSQQPALADDSGLVVPALEGMPGIYSARFAGNLATDRENSNLLLKKLKDIPDTERKAFFYCVLVSMKNAQDPAPVIVTGRLAGMITHKHLGENGFGYDPVFYLTEYGCTIAQLSSQIKNTISHRAQALYLLTQAWKA